LVLPEQAVFFYGGGFSG